MVDLESTVCCMCGDIGFPDKLFRCYKCHTRFQHSYCSNYYGEIAEPIEVCDWCAQSERISRRSITSKKSGVMAGISNRSEYSGEKVKHPSGPSVMDHHRGGSGSGDAQTEKNSNGGPSPRPTTRRYKLLKDVMC